MAGNPVKILICKSLHITFYTHTYKYLNLLPSSIVYMYACMYICIDEYAIQSTMKTMKRVQTVFTYKTYI